VTSAAFFGDKFTNPYRAGRCRPYRVSDFDVDMVTNFVSRSVLAPCAFPPRYCRPRRCGQLSKNSSLATVRAILWSSGEPRLCCVSSTPAVPSCTSTVRPTPATSRRWGRIRLGAMEINSGTADALPRKGSCSGRYRNTYGFMGNTASSLRKTLRPGARYQSTWGATHCRGMPTAERGKFGYWQSQDNNTALTVTQFSPTTRSYWQPTHNTEPSTHRYCHA
jgi:hypothetical protein